MGIFLAFLRLGCLSFGGPIAHLGYFRAEFVGHRRWLSENTFAEIIALAQSMPGPSSSQTGFVLGLLRGGLPGACAAWLGFTTPSALLMLGFAFGYGVFTGRIAQSVVHGLQLVAVAVVAQAVLTMQRSLAPDRMRMLVALAAAAVVLFVPLSLGTLLAIAFGAMAGVALVPSGESRGADLFEVPLSKRGGAVAAFVFALLLFAALTVRRPGIGPATIFAEFYSAGALVFGGGHVVLPLLNDAVVSKGWISPGGFMAGYGVAQALPGPLFTFAAYLGAAVRPNPHPLLFGLEALVSIFLPGLLIVLAALPFWRTLRERASVRTGLAGVNASVVGVLIAALYRPVWTSTVHTALDFWMALLAFTLLTLWKAQPWAVVLGMGAFYSLIAMLR